MKGYQALHNKNDRLRKKLEDKTAKVQRDKFEKQALVESHELMPDKIKSIIIT